MRLVLSAFLRYLRVLKYFNHTHLLASQYYPDQLDKAIEYARDVKGVTLIIDSGAFSAWNSNMPIVLDDYVKVLKDFSTYLHLFKEVHIVNLDVIPGSPNQKVTYEQVESAAEEGLQNYIKLLNLDLKGYSSIIHVFHQGESISLLKRILQLNPTYIGISPSNSSTTQQRQFWLDEAFKHLPQSIHAHGFAVTSHQLMYQYPWFSVDSISWFILGVYGKLLIPLDAAGNIITDSTTRITDKFEVSISPRTLYSRPQGYLYIKQMQPSLFNKVNNYIKYLCYTFPLSLVDLFSDNPTARVMANLHVFRRMAECADVHNVVCNSLF